MRFALLAIFAFTLSAPSYADKVSATHGKAVIELDTATNEVNFSTKGPVINRVVITAHKDTVHEIDAIFAKFADWQATAKRENVSNLKKRVGHIKWKRPLSESQSDSLLRAYGRTHITKLTSFEFIVDEAGKTNLNATALYGSCEGFGESDALPEDCTESFKPGGYISPEEAADMRTLIADFNGLTASTAKSDLFK